jgi:hypothetical protein
MDYKKIYEDIMNFDMKVWKGTQGLITLFRFKQIEFPYIANSQF